MPLREFIQVPQADNPKLKIWKERLSYAPTDYNRVKALAFIPFGKRGIAKWFSGSGTRKLHVGLPENIEDPKKCWVRSFTTREERDAIEKVTMRNNPESYELVAEWEPLPEGVEESKAVIVLTLHCVRREGAPAISGDGLDAKNLNQLKTIVGVESVKGPDGKPLATKNMSEAEMVAHIRDHRNRKAQAQEKPLESAAR